MSNNIFKKIDSSLTSYSPRTRFDLSKHHLTSVNAGRVYPIYLEECLPGDTWQMDLHSLVRMQTPIAPIMDDIFGDYYFFFVPYRLLDENFEKVITISDWAGSTTSFLDTFAMGTDFSINSRSLANYLGLPIGKYNYQTYHKKLSTAPFKAYTMIWNEFFRDENYQSEKVFSNNVYGSLVDEDKWLDTNQPNISITTMCAPANERHDLFTSVLPAPQKGNSVLLPIGDVAPVVARGSVHPTGDVIRFSGSSEPVDGLISNVYLGSSGQLIKDGEDLNQPSPYYSMNETNLFADLSTATAATINSLREAIVMQHFLETLARTGSRYTEYLKGFWGVNAPDARLQRPEFIAEWHTNINVSEVVQTAGLDEASGTTLGSTGAVSRTGTSKNGLFTYSCVEHGFLIGVYVVRHKLSYSQGISNLWFRQQGTDFYNPVFNGLGETAVFKRSILAPVQYDATLMKEAYSNASSSVSLDDVLGYNEAWSEYKFKYNQTSGMLNPVALQGLDYWTLTKAFTTATITGSDVRISNEDTLDRSLSISVRDDNGSYTGADQFICDFYFDVKCTRRMPLRSTPGVNKI